MFLVASTVRSSQLIRKMCLSLADGVHRTEEGKLSRSPILLETQRSVMKHGARTNHAGMARKLGLTTDKVECAPTALFEKDSVGDPAIRSLVIIGSGRAGSAAAEHARRLRPDCAIHIVAQESHVLQNQTGRAEPPPHPDARCQEQRTSRWANTYVAEIDTDKRRILLANGKHLAYDRLIIANGSSTQKPLIAGFGASGTFVLRDSGDMADLHSFIHSNACRKVIVASAGLLGLEAAYTLQKMGLSVSVLLTADGFLNRQFDARSRSLLQRYTEHQGIEILAGVNAASLVCDNMDRVCAVRLNDGSKLATDAFLACVDARPDVRLAKAAGIATRHGLLVDDYMQTSQVDIYAAGDVAEHDGSTTCVGALAVEQGEIAACNALGGHRRYNGHMRSTLLKAPGIDLLSVGEINADGKGMCAIVSEHSERFKYRKLILASGCLLGAILIGYPDETALVSSLVERGADLTPQLPALRRGNWDVLTQLKTPS